VFGASDDLHLGGRRLHDLGCLIAANVSCVRATIVTVTDDMNQAWSREIHAPEHGAAVTAKHDRRHVVSESNRRASGERAMW